NGYSRPKPSARTRSVGRLRAYMSAASPAAWTYFVLPVLDADAVKFLAQVGLQHLARGIPRQHVGEQYRAGLPVAGQLVPGKVDDVLLGGRRSALATTTARTVSPQRASGMPMTATSATSGCL